MWPRRSTEEGRPKPPPGAVRVLPPASTAPPASPALPYDRLSQPDPPLVVDGRPATLPLPSERARRPSAELSRTSPPGVPLHLPAFPPAGPMSPEALSDISSPISSVGSLVGSPPGSVGSVAGSYGAPVPGGGNGNPFLFGTQPSTPMPQSSFMPRTSSLRPAQKTEQRAPAAADRSSFAVPSRRGTQPTTPHQQANPAVVMSPNSASPVSPLASPTGLRLSATPPPGGLTPHPARTASLRGQRPEDLAAPIGIVGVVSPAEMARGTPTPPPVGGEYYDDPLRRSDTGRSDADRRSVGSVLSGTSSTLGASSTLGGGNHLAPGRASPDMLAEPAVPVARARSDPALLGYPSPSGGDRRSVSSLSSLPALDEDDPPRPSNASFIAGQEAMAFSNVVSIDAWASTAGRGPGMGERTVSSSTIPPRQQTIPSQRPSIPSRDVSLPKFTPDELLDKGVHNLDPAFSKRFAPDAALLEFAQARKLASAAADIFREARCYMDEGVALAHLPGREAQAYARLKEAWDMARRCVMRARNRTLWTELADAIMEDWEDEAAPPEGAGGEDEAVTTTQAKARARRRRGEAGALPAGAGYRPVSKGGLMAPDPATGPPMVAFLLDLMVNLGNCCARMHGRRAEALAWHEGVLELADRTVAAYPEPEPGKDGRARPSQIHRHLLYSRAAAWTHIGALLTLEGRPVEAAGCHRRALELCDALQPRIEAACARYGKQVAEMLGGQTSNHPPRTSSIAAPARSASTASASSASTLVNPPAPPSRQVLEDLRNAVFTCARLRAAALSHLASAHQACGQLRLAVRLRRAAVGEFARCGDVLGLARERANAAGLLAEWGRALAQAARGESEAAAAAGRAEAPGNGEVADAAEAVVLGGGAALLRDAGLYDLKPRGAAVSQMPPLEQTKIVEGVGVCGMMASIASLLSTISLPRPALKYADALLYNSAASVRRSQASTVDLMDRPPQRDPLFPVLLPSGPQVAYLSLLQLLDRQPGDAGPRADLAGLDGLLLALRLAPERFRSFPPETRDAGLRMLQDAVRAMRANLLDEEGGWVLTESGAVPRGAAAAEKARARAEELALRATGRLGGDRRGLQRRVDAGKLLAMLEVARAQLMGSAGLFAWVADGGTEPQWERDLRSGWARDGLEALGAVVSEVVEAGEEAKAQNGRARREAALASVLASPVRADGTVVAPPRSTSRRRRQGSSDSGKSGPPVKPPLAERLAALCQEWLQDSMQGLPSIAEDEAGTPLSPEPSPASDGPWARAGVRMPFMPTTALARILESVAELGAVRYPENPFAMASADPATTLVTPLPYEIGELLRQTAQALALKHTLGSCRACLAAFARRVADGEGSALRPVASLRRSSTGGARRSDSARTQISPPGPRNSSLSQANGPPPSAGSDPARAPSVRRSDSLLVSKRRGPSQDDWVAGLLGEMGGACPHVDPAAAQGSSVVREVVA